MVRQKDIQRCKRRTRLDMKHRTGGFKYIENFGINGRPHLNGNTVAMVEVFVKGAEQNGHDVTVVPVCSKHISWCKACEYCHTKGDGKCIQQDDMQEINFRSATEHSYSL